MSKSSLVDVVVGGGVGYLSEEFYPDFDHRKVRCVGDSVYMVRVSAMLEEEGGGFALGENMSSRVVL